MPVVKADAYGHGAAAVARRLVARGAPCWPSPIPRKAVGLRQAGIEVPIVVLAGFAAAPGPPARSSTGSRRSSSTPAQLAARSCASRGRRPRRCRPRQGRHGDGAAGLRARRVRRRGRCASRDRGVDVEGLMTHLACADEDRGRRPRASSTASTTRSRRLAAARAAPAAGPRRQQRRARPRARPTTRSRGRACCSTACTRARWRRTSTCGRS